MGMVENPRVGFFSRRLHDASRSARDVRESGAPISRAGLARGAGPASSFLAATGSLCLLAAETPMKRQVPPLEQSVAPDSTELFSNGELLFMGLRSGIGPTLVFALPLSVHRDILGARMGLEVGRGAVATCIQDC